MMEANPTTVQDPSGNSPELKSQSPTTTVLEQRVDQMEKNMSKLKSFVDINL